MILQGLSEKKEKSYKDTEARRKRWGWLEVYSIE